MKIIIVKDINKILTSCSKNVIKYKDSIVTDEKEVYYSDGATFWEVSIRLYKQIKAVSKI